MFRLRSLGNVLKENKNMFTQICMGASNKKRGGRKSDSVLTEKGWKKPGVLQKEKEQAAEAAAEAAKKAAAPVISFSSKESLKVSLGSDGLASFHVAGILDLEVKEPQKNGFFKIKFDSEESEVKWRAHQLMEPILFDTQHILQNYTRDDPFPKCRPLKWTLETKDETYVPLQINCSTVDVDGEKVKVKVEYVSFLRFVLEKVVISVPIPPGETPYVSYYTGIWRPKFNSGNSKMEWDMSGVGDSNRTGYMEFCVGRVDRSVFFPISVDLKAASTYINLNLHVLPLKANQDKPKFTHTQKMVTDKEDDYLISG